MKQSVWNKRIPSLLVFIFLIGAFLLTTYFTGNSTNLISKASPSQTPLDVKITNISDTSFTISYHTSDNVLGSISYGGSTTQPNIVLDDRDSQAKTAQAHTVHYFTIMHLQPTTTYTFIIHSGSQTYKNGSSPYKVTTGSSLPTQTSHIESGHVIFTAQTPNEAIVYFNIIGSQTLSTLVQKNNTYSFNIGLLRDQTNMNSMDTSSRIGMLLVQGQTLQSTAQFNIDQTTAIPTIILGNTYDFTIGTNTFTTQTSSASAGLPLQNVSVAPSGTVRILVPTVGQAFSTQLPSFNGTAAPYASVTVTIDNTVKTQTLIQADANGYWQYTIKSPLSPGKHTLTITALDGLGVTRTTSVLFYQYASGANFLVPSVSPIQAGPSPSLTPIPTTQPTPTVTLIPSPTPITATPESATPTPANTDTPVPTFTPTPTTAVVAQITNTPQPTGTLLKAGSNAAVWDTIIALIPVVLGGILIYLSKGVIR